VIMMKEKRENRKKEDRTLLTMIAKKYENNK
jgi:hypothetical protein